MGGDMDEDNTQDRSAFSDAQSPALRFLVESALKTVISGKAQSQPRSREDWVARLCDQLMSDSETSHQAVLSQLMATGVSSEELYQHYIPAAARKLGQLWLNDEASFVDVTVGASRLQALFRARAGGGALDRSIPLGQSVLMVVPQHEQHSLGAFVAADNMRRHGVWVHMGIGLNHAEIAELVATNRFSMIGLTAATWNSVVNATEIVDYLRSNVEGVPPIVIGGRAAAEKDKVVRRTGADHAVQSAREAVEKCGLVTVGGAALFDKVT